MECIAAEPSGCEGSASRMSLSGLVPRGGRRVDGTKSLSHENGLQPSDYIDISSRALQDPLPPPGQYHGRETSCHGLSWTRKSQKPKPLRRPIVIVQAYRARVISYLSRAAPRHSRRMCWAIIQGRKSNFGVTHLVLPPMRPYSNAVKGISGAR